MGNGTAELLGGGASTSFPFAKPGDRLRGVIVSAGTQVQTVMEGEHKGETIYWDAEKTQPKKAVVATVQTEPAIKVIEYVDQYGQAKRVESETGRWGVFFSGNKFTKLRDAAPNGLNEGDVIDVLFSAFSDRAPKVRGGSPAKLYEITVTPAPKGTGPLASAPTTGTASTGSTSTASAAAGEVHGPKPAEFPQAAWDAMPPAARATVSPYVAPPAAPVAATYGPRPSYLPEAAWALMDDAAKAIASPAAVVGVARPDFIPEVAWNVMDEAARLLAVGSASPV